METFNAGEYFEAIEAAVKYGLTALVIMLVLGTILTLASGGLAARGWVKTAEQHH
jgi:hypothetical protein